MAQESILLHNISREEFFNKLNELKRELTEKNTLPLQVEPDKKELMSPEEVANYFKVHISTIENWSKQGYLIKYGIGRPVYYKRSEVESSIKRL